MIGHTHFLRRHFLLTILVLCAAGTLVGPGVLAGQQRSKPLTKQEIVTLLKGEVSHTRIEDLARERGVGFQMTPQAERDLRAAGADDALLRALRSAAKAAPRESAPPAASPETDDSADAAEAFPAPAVRPGETYFPALGIVTPESQPADYPVIDVLEVAHGSPAEGAGLQSACTILTLAGVRVTSPQQLQKVLAQHRAGETVEITFNDGSLVHTARLRLASSKSSRGTR